MEFLLVIFVSLGGAEKQRKGRYENQKYTHCQSCPGSHWPSSGLDKQKLQGAPKVSRNDLRQLSDMTFANSVYEYYGKQPYWGTMAPTGRTGQ